MLLGALSRCAYETVKEMMQAAIVDNTVTAGMIAAILAFCSNDIHWHPHLHCLVTNGCFDKDRTFPFASGKTGEVCPKKG